MGPFAAAVWFLIWYNPENGTNEEMLEVTARDRYVWSRRVNGFLHPFTLRCYAAACPWKLALLPFKALALAASAAVRALEFRFRRAALRRKVRGLSFRRVGDGVRPIAFYLPQFHAFPENDAWWGKGFTEWTNVRAAKPLYDGHPQPQVPHPDLGYYDLADVGVMRRQAEMARRYGVAGFCFYYYRFKDGKRLLEKPVDNWLAAKDIDFPFCFCWANENWTRAWTGGDREVLMPQDYGIENMVGMLREMLPAFRDPRYIRVGGRPLLLVYRPEIVPEMLKVSGLWREVVREAGLDGLHLVSVQNFSKADPRTFGLDAATEFASFHAAQSAFRSPVLAPETCRVANALRYADVVDACVRRPAPAYPRYRSVCPGWDNTPRRGERGTALIGATPAAFRKFAAQASALTLAERGADGEGFLFVNAWNEWAESAHLEPDARDGYANLEALRDVMDLDMKGLADSL